MRQLTTLMVSLMGVLAAPLFAQVYIADSQDNEIRAVNTTTGIISTAAGDGTAGYSGDGGAAINAELRDPTGIAVDSSGNLYIADTQNNRIRKSVGGIITTVAGIGTPGSGGVPGLAINAQLNNPTGVAVDSTGNIYIADEYNNRILKVDTTGHITAVAGTGAPGYSGDGGPATSALLYYPTGVAVDGGILYIADSKNNRVRAVSVTGTITTYAGTSATNFSGVCPNGIATALPLNTPWGVAVDGSHNLYIADEADWCIRKVTTSGAMTTVAGGINSTTYNPPGDGSLATKVGLNYPTGVAVDGSGNLYIVDDDNNAVRKVVLSTGIITTFAGSGAPGCSPPAPATAGRPSTPNCATRLASRCLVSANR